MTRTVRARRWIPGALLLAAATTAATLAAGMPALAADTTLYVGGTGCSSAGPGDQAHPFCTIGQAAAQVNPGQTVQVAAGTYPERVSITRSGATGSPAVFQAAPGATVTVTGGTNGFALSSVHDVTVRGFTVTATSSYGISVSNSHDVTVTGNTVTYAGHPLQSQIASGIFVGGTSNSTISGNQSDHNSDHGIYLTSGSTGITVQGNEASWNANGYRRNANGINVVSAGNAVIGNVTHDNEDSGIQFYPGGNDNLATLNVTYNNGDHGIDDLNVTGGRIIGNTVYHNCTTGINVEGTSGDYQVLNNVAVDNAVYPAYNGIACSRRAGNIGIWDSAPATTTLDGNVVWLTRSGTMEVFGSSYTSQAALRAATGQEQHGTQADPRFVNATTGDLRVLEGSPAIDSALSGASGEQTTDILGVARTDDPNVANTGTGPRPYDDRGAYEFTPDGTPPPPQPPTAALTVTPGSGTAPVAVTADASASSDPQGETLSYTFAFGDGTTVGPQPAPTAGHTYTAAGSYQVTVTVTNTDGLSATASAPVSVTSSGGGGGGNPAYVSQIATNYSTTAHTTGSITVWRTQGVAAGDLELVTLALGGTSATGTVGGSDDAGNTLSVVSDTADGAGHRLVVLAGMVNTALVPNNKITVSFPSATEYRMTGDELSGVSGVVDQRASATGSGSAFSSGATGITSTAPEFVFGTVALFAGATPGWASGWTPLTSYAVGTDYLGRAYRISSTTGSFTASGTGAGAWLAACVTLR